MIPRASRYNRILLFLLTLLYAITLVAFNYAEWRAEPEHLLWMTVLNALILSLPLILFYGSIYLMVSSWHEYRQTGQINPRLAKTIHWAPRIAAIIIIFFVSLFSLDVFGMEGAPLELLGAFVMHSIPSILLIMLLAFAWRRPAIGFVAFLLAGLFFLRFVLSSRDLGLFLLFSGPMFLIAGLFYADWRWKQLLPPPAAPHEGAI